MEQKQQDDANEALTQYFPEGKWELERDTKGYSHVTIFVKTPSDSFVLRIYRNQATLDKIKKEHDYLNQLSSIKSSSIEFPQVLPSVKGETIIKLSNGQHASLFKRIPGSCPDFLNLEHWKYMGRGTAEVLKAFEALKSDSMPEITPSYMFYSFWATISREKFLELIKDPVLADEFPEEVDLFLREAELLEKALNSVSLPVQTIHGDLHTSNFLIFDSKVSGVVDVEYTKPGWRVMDVATAISNFGDKQTDFMACVDSFAKGFCEEGELTEEELKAIPLVMKTRFVALFVSCLEWYSKEKTDKILNFCKRALKFGSQRINWANEAQEKIVQAFESRMKSRSTKQK